MKKNIWILLLLVSIPFSLAWSQVRYGETICKQPGFYCLKIKSGDRWNTLFPNLETADLIRRINRMNIRLRPDMTIAVPLNIDRLSIYDASPFPRYIEQKGEKTIYVNQMKLAWGAYDENGELVWWGPISSGSNQCRAKGGCLTPSGFFRIIRKQDSECVSTVFPQEDGLEGGARMPYCMHFFRGFALHGSEDLPGYRASHGCIRLFTEDARWLNEEFIELPGAGGVKGTRVIIDGISS